MEHGKRVLPDGGERRDDQADTDYPDQPREDWSTDSGEPRRTRDDRPRDHDERPPPAERPREDRRADDRPREDHPPRDRPREDRRAREAQPRDRRARDRPRDQRPQADRRAPPPSRSAESRRLTDRIPWGRGAVTGLFVYGIGYAIIYGFLLSEESASSGSSGSLIPEHVSAGWVFYNAHNVEISSRMGTANLLESSGAQFNSVPKVAYYAVPAVLLLIAGYVVARSTLARSRHSDPADGALAGACIVVGYLVLAVVGAAVLFKFQPGGFGGSVSFQPELGTSVAIMGLAYPILLGGIGGALAGLTTSSQRAPAPR